jgi:hypothetical protein
MLGAHWEYMIVPVRGVGLFVVVVVAVLVASGGAAGGIAA